MNWPVAIAFGILVFGIVLLIALLVLTVRVSGRALAERNIALMSTMALEEIQDLSSKHNDVYPLGKINRISEETLDEVRGVGLKKLVRDEWGL